MFHMSCKVAKAFSMACKLLEYAGGETLVLVNAWVARRVCGFEVQWQSGPQGVWLHRLGSGPEGHFARGVISKSRMRWVYPLECHVPTRKITSPNL